MCLFCDEGWQDQGHGILLELPKAFVKFDSFPVTEGHMLIIPFEHKETFWDLSNEELNDIYTLCDIMREHLQEEDPSITGFNIGWNCGASAGQTVMHAHCHLIPRRDGDVEDPIGGVRNIIQGKGNYKNE